MLGAALLAAQWLLAQAPPAKTKDARPGKSGDQAPLRVVSRVVQVDAVVTDSKGAPITDLTLKDFKILDTGKEQRVSHLEIADGRAPKAPAAAATETFRFTNRIPVNPVARAPVLYVVLFDGLNTQVTDQAYAREHIVRFLNSVRPGELVAIYILGSSLRVAHDFTTDLAALRRTAERLANPTLLFDTTPLDIAPSPEAAFAEFASISEKRFEVTLIQNRVRYTLRALEAIARRLESAPGRKNLLWVSAAFPLALGLQNPDTTYARLDLMRGFTEDLSRTLRAVNDANIAIYPIDSRGLMASFQEGSRLPKEAQEGGPLTQIRRGSVGKSSTGAGADSAAPSTQVNNPFETREVDRTQYTMREMADLTGGRAFYNTNDLAGALHEAMQDSQFTYVLGYSPQHNQWDGRFHEIKVEVNRPGARVRFRRGYFATPEASMDAEAAQGALTDAAQAPLPASAVEMDARFEKNPTGKDFCVMRLRVSPQNVSLVRTGEAYTGVVDLLIELADAQGQRLWADGQRVSLKLKPETYARITRDGLLFTIRIPAKAGATEIRAAVQDGATAKYGTLRVPLSAITESLR